MTRIALIVPVLLAALACRGDSEEETDTDAGGCTGGDLVITTTGLPPGASGLVETPYAFEIVSADGPTTLTIPAEEADTMLYAGLVFDASGAMPLAYGTNPRWTPICVSGETPLELAYVPVPTSGHLWASNANGTAPLLGFAEADVSAGGNADALAFTGDFGRSIAFDVNGDVWTALGAEARLNRYLSWDFASAGAVTAAESVTIAGVDCIPALSGVDVTSEGIVYASSPCADLGIAIRPEDLEAGGTVTPSATFPLVDAQDVVEDGSRGAWFAHAGGLTHATVDTTDTITLSPVRSDASALAANAVAMHGNDLWAIDFGANQVYRIDRLDLTAEGTVTAAVVISVGVEAVLEGMAFDAEGGLWLDGPGGALWRLSPGQLLTSSDPGAPTVPDRVITSADIGSASGLAILLPR